MFTFFLLITGRKEAIGFQMMFYSMFIMHSFKKTIEETDFADEGSKVSKDRYAIHGGRQTPLARVPGGLVRNSLRNSLGFLSPSELDQQEENKEASVDETNEPDVDVDDLEIGNTAHSSGSSEEKEEQEAKEEIVTVLKLPR